MKKVLSIIGIVSGSLILSSVVVPMIIGEILKAQTVVDSIGIIGGADGSTAIMIVGTVGAGDILIEIVIGVLLIVAGIWGLKKFQK